MAFAICVPWLLRDRIILAAWVPIRDNFGLEVWLSNADNATADMVGNRMSERHPMYNAETAARIREAGEVEFNRQALRTAIAWVSTHPSRFAALTAARIRLYWFPAGQPAVWAITLLSFVGLFLAPRRIALMLFPFLLIYPLPFYVVQASARYRYPVLWVSALLAGYAVASIAKHSRDVSAVESANAVS